MKPFPTDPGYSPLPLPWPGSTAMLAAWPQADASPAALLAQLPTAEAEALAARIHHPQRLYQAAMARLALEKLAPGSLPVSKSGGGPLGTALGHRASLSHTRYAALAAVCPTGAGIAADVELLGRPWQPGTLHLMMTPGEREWFGELKEEEQALGYYWLWCAKECMYKLLSASAKDISFARELSVAPLALPSAEGIFATGTFARTGALVELYSPGPVAHPNLAGVWLLPVFGYQPGD